MKIEVKDGKVSLQIEGSFTAEQLTQLVEQIGLARGQIAQDPVSLVGQMIDIPTAMAPPFWTLFNHEQNATLLFYRHVNFGWMGVTFTPEHVATLISLWSQQLLGATPTAPATAGTASDATDNNNGSAGGVLH